MNQKIIAAALILSLSSVAMAAKPGGEPAQVDAQPLEVFFFSAAPSNCDFYRAGIGAGSISGSVFNADSSSMNVRVSTQTIAEKDTYAERKRFLLELMIAFAGLSLTPDDFYDSVQGDFDCTNEKLLSLI